MFRHPFPALAPCSGQYGTQEKRRRRASKAIVESTAAPEDSDAVGVEDSPRKRSREQGLETAVGTSGEDLSFLGGPFFFADFFQKKGLNS